jgi:16S rRNA (cytosine1402-N4)-methyltransferase
VLVAFHSLEDRRIKRFIDDLSERRAKPSRHLPLVATARPKLRWLERKVIKPGDAEVARNPRARSARLRAAVRLADDEDQAGAGEANPVPPWRLAA